MKIENALLVLSILMAVLYYVGATVLIYIVHWVLNLTDKV